MSTAVRKYGFINAKLRTRLGNLLPEEFFSGLIRAASLSEAMLQLKETSYSSIGEVYENTGDLKLSELEFYSDEIKMLRELQSYLESDLADFINALLLRYEIDTFKSALRLWFDRVIRVRDISASTGYLYYDKIVHAVDFERIINSNSREELAGILEHTPYSAVFNKWAEHIETEKNLFPLEMDLDAFFYNNLYEASAKLSRSDRIIVKKIIGVEIDLENISRTIRLRTFYKMPVDQIINFSVKGGNRISTEIIRRAGSAASENDVIHSFIEDSYPGFSAFLSDDADHRRRLALIESLLDNVLKQETRKLLIGNPFTIGIILSYFFFKKNEHKRIMTILNAKNYEMTEEDLKGRV